MKGLLVCFIVALLAVNAYLAVNQHQLKRKIVTLEEANRDVAVALESNPPISAEELRRTRTQLYQAQMTPAATEKIITNFPQALQYAQVASAFGSPPPAGAPRQSSKFAAPKGALPVEALGPPPPMELGPPSSSHGQDGQLLQRSWGPEQMVGPPNTQEAGDYDTAWAPKTSRGAGEEWIHLGYDNTVEVAQVNVRETYNPGAVSKIAAILQNGQETVLWEGVEPASQAPANMSFSLPAGVQANQIKVYLDRRRVPGWNEIDAVELIGRDGSRQWATSAMASSSYAEPR